MWPGVSNITSLSFAILIIKTRLRWYPPHRSAWRTDWGPTHETPGPCPVEQACSRGNHRQVHTGDCSPNVPVVLPSFPVAFQPPFPTALVPISHFSFQFKKLPLHILSPCDSSVAVSTTTPISVAGTRFQSIRGCECLLQDLHWNRRREKHSSLFPGLLLCQDAQWELLVSHLWSSLPRKVSIERKADPRDGTGNSKPGVLILLCLKLDLPLDFSACGDNVFPFFCLNHLELGLCCLYWFSSEQKLKAKSDQQWLELHYMFGRHLSSTSDLLAASDKSFCSLSSQQSDQATVRSDHWGSSILRGSDLREIQHGGDQHHRGEVKSWFQILAVGPWTSYWPPQVSVSSTALWRYSI